MDIVVYKIKGNPAMYTAALVDFETLPKSSLFIDDDTFYITTNNEQELLEKVMKKVKKELRNQLKQNIINNE